MNMSRIIKAAGRFATSSDYRFLYLSNTGKYDSMPDEYYLKRKFKAIMGRELNVKNPITFNEKLQWLKLYDRKSLYTTLVDKYEVKKYVASIIGEEYIIPTIGVWDDPDEIDFEKLPNQFVLKCNHNSGLGMCICKDKNKLDYSKVRKELRKGLNQDYYLTGREWPYKNVKRKIIAEKFMVDHSLGGEKDLVDYKVHCFNGIPKVILVCRDRFSQSGMTEDFFTTDWIHLDIKRPNHKNAKYIERPKELEEMLKLAGKLAEGIPFSRIDFYTINGDVYFGEITFFPASGLQKFEPENYDEFFGKWLNIN